MSPRRARGGASRARCLLAALSLLASCRRGEEALEPPRLPPELASRLARLPLDCVDREYPNKPGSVLDGDSQVRPPRQATPAFSGCFDWHSSVHGHWTMARLLRTQPRLAEAPRLRAALDRHLRPELIAREVAHLSAPRNAGFERPYGWAWLLRLAAELHGWEDEGARRWAAALAPLDRLIARRLREYLPRLSAPIREGTHASTAFAMTHALDYARAVGDAALAAEVERGARRFFARDLDCPTHFEPSGEDFISPCLIEADLLRRVLPQRELVDWLERFLPEPGSLRFRPLATPTEVSDPKDYRIGHLIGLALQRASSYDGLASSLPEKDRRVAAYRRLGALHQRAALARLEASGYGGAHWLASFAVYLLTRVGVGP